MSHLDTAARTRDGVDNASTTTHFVGSIGRSLTVIDTSVNLARGDRTDGPPHAQLLMVCETVGDLVTNRQLSSIAIEAISRELVREDEWLLSLCKNESNHVSDTLAAAVRVARSSLQAFQPNESRDEDCPVTALAVALVAWPLVAAASTGDGVVAQRLWHQPKKPVEGSADASSSTMSTPDPAQTAADTPAQSESSDTTEIDSWSANFKDSEVLVLGTSEIRNLDLSGGDVTGRRCSKATTAREIADLLLQKVPPSRDVSIAVAKLSDGVAGQMQELAETSTPQHGVEPKSRENTELSEVPSKPIDEVGATN